MLSTLFDPTPGLDATMRSHPRADPRAKATRPFVPEAYIAAKKKGWKKGAKSSDGLREAVPVAPIQRGESRTVPEYSLEEMERDLATARATGDTQLAQRIEERIRAAQM